jgi:hypothetical protein
MDTPGKVSKTCGTCGKPFLIFKSRVRKGGGLHCSKKCRRAKARVERVAGVKPGIRLAFSLGYRANDEGGIVRPDGSPVRLSKHPRTGYWTFAARLCRSPLSVHQFVAFQKYGEPALRSECVRHLNDDRDDNRPTNIDHGTKSQNQMDIPIEKRRAMGTRRNRKKRQFTDDQVREIRLLFAAGWSLNRLQRVFDCALGALSNIRDGVTYQDVPDR